MTPEPASGTAQGIVLPAAATTTVRTLIEGPVQGARLLMAFPRAAYVQLAAGEVVAVLTQDAVRLPCGLVIAARSTERSLAPLRGPVLVGGSQVSVGAVTVRLVRIRSARPPAGLVPDPRAVEQVTARLAALSFAEHDPALLEALAQYGDAVPQADRLADALLGAGSGLTPSGDDVLAGFLVTARAVGVPCEALAAAVMSRARSRTVHLSATLLGHACRGESVPQVTRLMRAVCDPAASSAAREAALAETVLIGHTSGLALATGVLAACRAGLRHR